MLSEPPNRHDLRALSELVSMQRDVGDRRRDRLLAMHLVSGPPYELTARGRLLAGAVALGLLLSACGGDAFIVGPEPDGGVVSADRASPAPDGGASVDVLIDADAAPAARDGLAGWPEPDAGRDAPGEATAWPDAGALPDIVAPPPAPDAADASGPLDSGPTPDAPACVATELMTFASSTCMCESPPTYTCLTRGAVCGNCPPSAPGNPLGHADGSCATPNVCTPGAPCAYQASSGALVMGSVVRCP